MSGSDASGLSYLTTTKCHQQRHPVHNSTAELTRLHVTGQILGSCEIAVALLASEALSTGCYSLIGHRA